jgi:hypothetical protein
MTNVTADDLQGFDSVLSTVKQWPSALRLSLAQALLKSLEPEVTGKRQKVTGAEAQGILAGPWPTPSDAEVDHMVDDYLSEKFGK